MKELPYSDNDIVALYRGARHPLRQIGIIAQLCDCSAAEIMKRDLFIRMYQMPVSSVGYVKRYVPKSEGIL